MTSAEFRRAALHLPEAVASEHMGHPDFRVGGKIFATLNYPDHGWAMVKLTPAEQDAVMITQPRGFKPAPGAWGEKGATLVHLKVARTEAVSLALEAAWRARAPARLLGRAPSRAGMRLRSRRSR